MNAKQRKIIVDYFIQHNEYGYNSDLASAFNDTMSFLHNLIESDKLLVKESKIAYDIWVEDE